LAVAGRRGPDEDGRLLRFAFRLFDLDPDFVGVELPNKRGRLLLEDAVEGHGGARRVGRDLEEILECGRLGSTEIFGLHPHRIGRDLPGALKRFQQAVQQGLLTGAHFDLVHPILVSLHTDCDQDLSAG